MLLGLDYGGAITYRVDKDGRGGGRGSLCRTLDTLQQILVLHEACADFFLRAINLVELIDVVLIGTQSLVVDVVDAALGAERRGLVRLVQAQKLVSIAVSLV